MKKSVVAVVIGVFTGLAGAALPPVLIPMPVKCEIGSGSLQLSTPEISSSVAKSISDATIPAEGYRLEVSDAGISIASSDAAGLFYALETLKQLAVRDGKSGLSVPFAKIEDAPAFRWRGVLFDDCRHFFGKESLKTVLDLMAMHKYNVLHWHLTEDQGWRLEIPGYPDLVKYGAVRPASPKHGEMLIDGPDGRKKMELDNTRYGPYFYTEADVREILAYAAERHITVVPEIELPGHVYAALAAYPKFACVPGNLSHRHPRLIWGIEKDVLCLGNNEALKFMEDVLDYVCRVFPSPYVHIGGDECPADRWRECPKCQSRMKSEGLKSEKELQPWVTRRFVKFLEARGKRVIGWDEYLNGDIPTSAIGMRWRMSSDGGAGHDFLSPAECIARGHEMVITPMPFTYFYLGQGLPGDPFQYGCSGRPYGGGDLTLEKTYSFDPLEGIPESGWSHVLGGQCCNWSEYTWNEYDLAWKMWPRGCAMAEVLWRGKTKPCFPDFLERMRMHRERLLALGVNCAPLR